MIIETDHPRYGKVKQVATPVKAGPARNDNRRAPQRNEDASYVLTELLNYDAAKVSQLAADQAFTDK
jgi:crotonobetainyl-CoA:carnitine CoA-transferase CaiB-like acyl-CoA transferase